MATILPIGGTRDKTYTASGSMTDRINRIVKLSAARTVAIAGAGEHCHGVLKNAPADGGQASVITFGEALVYVDATTPILIGDRIMAAANGVGVKCGATAKTAYEILGVAQEAKASGTGTIIVDINPGTISVPST
jgi:hypothetical protein